MPDVCVRSSVAARPPSNAGTGRVQVQRVLHVARGMLRRHVERFEVVVIVLELRPLDDDEAEPQEDRFDAVAQQRQRMAMTDERRAPRQRHVERVAGGPARQRRLRLFEPRLDILLERVGGLTRASAARPERPTPAP